MKLTVALLVVMAQLVMLPMQPGNRVQGAIEISANLGLPDVLRLGTSSVQSIIDAMTGFGDEFWKRKMRTFFAVLDSDHDGQIQEGYGGLVDRYIELAKLDEVQGKKLHRKLREIFEEYRGEVAEQGSVTVEGFVETIRAKGREANVKTTVQWFGLFFDLVDITGDGVVKKEAYALFCNAFQLSPEVAELSFKAVDVNNKGVIGYDEYLKAAMAYMTESDKNSPHNLFWGPLQN
jgi:Ca2+-binding EF-hand superfamily protein